LPVRFSWSVLVLLPFFNGGICDSKPKQFGQLRHREGEVYSLFAEVFSEGLRISWVAPQPFEMDRIEGFASDNPAVTNTQQGQFEQA
jgi:hypothetical protein